MGGANQPGKAAGLSNWGYTENPKTRLWECGQKLPRNWEEQISAADEFKWSKYNNLVEERSVEDGRQTFTLWRSDTGLCGGSRLGFDCSLLQEWPDPAWERTWRSWWRRRRKHVSKKGQQLGAQHPSEGSGSRKDPYKSWGRDICEQWYHLMTLQLTSEEHWRRWSVSVRSSISQPRWTTFSRQNCIAHVQENCVNCPSLGCCLLYSVYCAVPNPWMMLLRKAPEIRSIWGMLCCSHQSHLNQLSLQSKFPLQVQQLVEMT